MLEDMNLVIISILSFLVFLELFLIVSLQKRLKNIFRGTKGRDLEQVMNIIGHHVEKLEKDREIIQKHLSVVDKRLSRSVRNIETLRFNPFEDQSGGNQSFAIAMLNDEGDGVIISSLYARDRMSVFAKPVLAGKPAQDLTKEEKTVFEKALK